MKSKSSCHIFCSCELSSLWNSVCSIVSFNLHNETKKWILAKIDANWNPMEGSCFWYLIFICFWWKEFTISYNYLTKNGKNFTISYDYLTKSLPLPFRGIEPSSSSADIKKAYHKAALKHHPDKVLYSFFHLLWLAFFSSLTVIMPQAGKFLVRTENISDAAWREITNEIRRYADYLFKIIGNAYNSFQALQW